MQWAQEIALLATVGATACALGGTPVLAWSLGGAAACVLAAVVLAAGALRDPPTRRFLFFPLLFLAWCAVATGWSGAPARSWFFIAQFGAWTAAALTSFSLARRGGGRSLAAGLLVFAVFEACYGLYQYLTGDQRIFWYAKTKYLQDATGTFLNHNHFAGFLLLWVAPALALAVTGRGRVRGVAAAAAAACLLLGIVFSRSRLGLACTVGSLALFTVYVASRRRQAGVALALLLASVAAYGLWIGLGPVGERFSYFSQSGYLSREGRLTLWRDTLQLVRQRPFTGWGPGMFPAVYGLERTEPSELRWMEAHSDYLQMLCETGIVGMLLFFAPLWALTAALGRRAWRAADWSGLAAAAWACSLAGILVHSAAEFHWYVPAMAMTMAVVAGLAAAELPGR